MTLYPLSSPFAKRNPFSLPMEWQASHCIPILWTKRSNPGAIGSLNPGLQLLSCTTRFRSLLYTHSAFLQQISMDHRVLNLAYFRDQQMHFFFFCLHALCLKHVILLLRRRIWWFILKPKFLVSLERDSCATEDLPF